MSIIVTGSIAFDNIMDFPGKFADHILPDKIHILNVSFLVKGLKKQRGGTAGNIAYTLGLLGDRPLLYGTAGQDFAGYREGVEAAGVDTHAVKILEDDFTAICYITTDEVNNQITGFYPGAMARDRELSLYDLPARDAGPADYLADRAARDCALCPRGPRDGVALCLRAGAADHQPGGQRPGRRDRNGPM